MAWRNVPHAPVDRPTDKEVEVLQGLVNGQTFGEIAAALFITPTTTSKRLQTLTLRIGTRHTWQTVALAVARGWVQVPAVNP